MTKRPRFTFYADSDVANVLNSVKERGARRLSIYLNNAIKRFNNPPYQLVFPESNDVAVRSFRKFIEDSQQSILLVGLSLQFVVESCRDVLVDKVKNDVNLSVILLDQRIQNNNLTFLYLERRMRNAARIRELVSQLEKSTEFFVELRRMGQQYRADVDVRSCAEVPMFGLMGRDHGFETCRLRANIYTSLSLNRRHPFLEIDPRTRIGGRAYDVMYEYYRELEGRSEEVPEP